MERKKNSSLISGHLRVEDSSSPSMSETL